MKRWLVAALVTGGLFWVSQNAAYAQSHPSCNLLPPQERALCNRQFSQRRAVCTRQRNPQARNACLRSLLTRLNNCRRQRPNVRGNCVRAALGLRQPGRPGAISVGRICSFLPPRERSACARAISQRRSACSRQRDPRRRTACLRSLAARLNRCPRVAPAARGNCVRAALGIRPPTPIGAARACNFLPPQERGLCSQRIAQRRAACNRQGNPRIRQSCLRSLDGRLSNCSRQRPDLRDNCVRAALGIRPPTTISAGRICSLLPPPERRACAQRIAQRRLACQRNRNPRAREACLRSLASRLNICPRQRPDRRDDCVRSALGIRPPVSTAINVGRICSLLPPQERGACGRSIAQRRSACVRNPNPQARAACLRSLAARLNRCPRVAPAVRDDCVRATLGLRGGVVTQLNNYRRQMNSIRNRARALCGQLPPPQRRGCIRSLFPPAPPTN